MRVRVDGAWRARHAPGMRLAGMLGLVASVVVMPRLARAGHHSGAEVHDHRSSGGDSAPVVHDHRSSGGDGEPLVRDHRTTDGAVYVAPGDDVVVEDAGPSSGLSSARGPSWTLELGGVARRFTGPAIARMGTVDTTSGTTASYALDSGAPAAGDTAGAAFAVRATAPVSEHVYAGGELEFGGLTRSPIQLMTAEPDLQLSRAMVGGMAVAGVRARQGIAELAGELAGGVRVLSMTVQSSDAGDDDPSATETSIAGLVEARVRGALWVSPHVFVAAQAGVGVFDRDDVNIGVSLGFASHAFGGR
jgi:hypothetical protein